MINVIRKNPPKIKKVLTSQEELDRIPQDIINPNLFIELKGKLYSISDEIESIGKICDKRHKYLLEEYKSVLINSREKLDKQTDQVMNDLKLAIQKKKTETVPRFKNDLIEIQRKVQSLAKDLKAKEKELIKRHYDVSVLQEDEMFYSNQLSVAEELNMYLNYKQEMILKDKPTINASESSSGMMIGNRNNSCRNIHETQNRVLNSNLLLTSCPVVKIEKQFDLKERIIAKNLDRNNRDLSSNKTKYIRLAAMNDNKYMGIFRTIMDEVVATSQSNQIKKQNVHLPRFKPVILHRSSSCVRYLITSYNI